MVATGSVLDWQLLRPRKGTAMTETPTERAARAYCRMSEMPNCRICGRFVSLAKPPVGWFAHGEFGEDTSYVCRRCVPNWKPEDGKGRGPEAGYCGVIQEIP